MTARTIGVALLLTFVVTGMAKAQDSIRIASSSTVYPFVAAVAERFGQTSGFRAPVIESLGSGGAFKLFCASAGRGSPDIAGASRRITSAETGSCAANRVTAISEIAFGRDGIVLVNAKAGERFDLTLRDLFLAVAKTVPVKGKLAPNPYRRWDQINPALPHQDIMIFGPAPNHGTRDMLDELVMDVACQGLPEIQALDAKARQKACEALREDGPFIEVTEDYGVILQKLLAERQAVGILPFSYVAQKGDEVKAAVLDGRSPSEESIASGDYPLSRPLYVYVKKAHDGKTPGLREFLRELTSDKASGKNGYLTEIGLVPLPEPQRKAEAAKAAELPDLTL
jgi:phosphate transport system substrate-binding protein